MTHSPGAKVQRSSAEPWRGNRDSPGGFHCVREHSEWRCRYEVGRDRQIVCYPIIVFFCAPAHLHARAENSRGPGGATALTKTHWKPSWDPLTLASETFGRVGVITPAAHCSRPPPKSRALPHGLPCRVLGADLTDVEPGDGGLLVMVRGRRGSPPCPSHGARRRI
jgi:hypothetical protein